MLVSFHSNPVAFLTHQVHDDKSSISTTGNPASIDMSNKGSRALNHVETIQDVCVSFTTVRMDEEEVLVF